VAFDAPENRAGPNVGFIKEKFGYPEEDIYAWLKTVSYPRDCRSIPEKVVTDTLNLLEKAGVVKGERGLFDVTIFVDTAVAKLT